MTLPATMRAVLLTGHGGPEKLELKTDVPVPVPGPGEVTIRVGAAGVNNTDINTRLAWYSKGEGEDEDASWAGAPIRFPLIQGIDVCGRIAAVGDGVDPGRIGQRVLVEPCLREAAGKELDPPWFFGSECDGGFAEFTRVAARHAHAVTSDLSDAELASFPCSYSTAENMLTQARVGKGDHVLVTGASGGVGSAAVQLAKARDARVTAVTGPSKAGRVKDLGADSTISRNDDPVDALGRNAVDVVVDMVAGDQWPRLLEVLKPFGRYAVAGAIAGPIVELDVRTLYLKDLSFFGCTCPDTKVFTNLIKRIEEKKVSPLVAATYDLADIGKAQEMFIAKQFVGKIVLTI